MEHGGNDMLPNYYAVLNVNYHASIQEILEAFYSMVKNPQTDLEYIHMITDAYHCLSNPVDRDAYNAFYFNAPCWYSKPLWIAYRNERRRLEELQLRQMREARDQLTVAQIEATRTIVTTTTDASVESRNGEVEIQTGAKVNMEIAKVNDGKRKRPKRRRGNRRKNGNKGERGQKEEEGRSKNEVDKHREDGGDAKDAAKKLADSRWADPHTCVNGLASHPQEGWQMKLGQARCVVCDHRQCESTYRCGKCDAAFCKDCHLKRNNARRSGRTEPNS